MIIYGAGLAGLLAAQMLRRFQPVIYEAQLTLPHNHTALLRFRSEFVSQAIGIPFREVQVYKAVKSCGQVRSVLTLRDANLYSHKVTGQLIERSILSLEPVKRYIAPPDLVAQMSRNVVIEYGQVIQTAEQIQQHEQQYHWIVSTIPMPVLMEIVQWPKDDEMAFQFKSIWTVTARIAEPMVRLYQTIYYPEADDAYYRASVTDDILIIEYMQPVETLKIAESHIASILRDFGLDTGCVEGVVITHQKYGKLIPARSNQARKSFMFTMTQRYRLYSLGRFATWRQVLLDDVVKDVGVIESLMASREAYDQHLASAREG